MTTRTLLLVRHAEAGPTPSGGTDRDRPLTPHGRAQAAAIGRLIAGGTLPEPAVAFTSSAARARETWAVAAEAAGLAVPTFAEQALYAADLDALTDLIRELSDGVRTLAVVGHAPEIPALARRVRDARPDGVPLLGWPPAGVGVVEVAGGWADFPRSGRLVFARAVEPD
nr:hypothetical protein [Propionibacterium sp.]